MDDFENFVTECLIKVQTFFESICDKKKSQLDGLLKFTKKILTECSVSTQKTTPE